ncbi:3D domain-containing protein [Bacillus sp. T33-2]|uniref:3D domain-containing protein n=1 Tax=Bacillus sp. T33-2 TaxID=2054168 RepID=UPI000C794EAA|nr:3D domain-containing protein [Bacillus sp. T33-2]PLR98766.1 peptidoglycan-binding protein [Bacillus sp. T33-2]
MRKSILSLVAVAAISGAAGANAQAEEIVVHKGDTLWGISKQYGVSVESIKEWNNLSNDTIHPNDRLQVSPVKYVQVRQGDTLWNIAKVYGVTVEDLKLWNKLGTDLIKPGMQLVLYTAMPDEMKVEAASTQPQGQAPVQSTPAAAQPAAAAQAAAPPAGNQSFTVEATAYTAYCGGCSGITATGVDLRSNPDAKVIAVDPSVIPLGSKVYVEGYGYATASDTGGAIKGNRIDVFIPDQNSALQWGRKQVKVTIIN